MRSDVNEKIFQQVNFRQAPALPAVAYKEVRINKDGTALKGVKADKNLEDLTDGKISITGLSDASKWELAGDTPDWAAVTYEGTAAATTATITIAANDKTDQSAVSNPKARQATIMIRHKEYPTSTLIPVVIRQSVEETTKP